MAILVVGGVTVTVAVGQREPPTVIGDSGRALDGTMLSTVRARKKRWSVTTSPMSQADAATLEAALVATPPVTCSGDLLGASTSCHIEVGAIDNLEGVSPYLVVISFSLDEA